MGDSSSVITVSAAVDLCGWSVNWMRSWAEKERGEEIKSVLSCFVFLHRGNQKTRAQKRTVMLKRSNRRPQLMAAPTLPATAMASRRKWSRRRVDRLNVSICRVSGGASGQGLISGPNTHAFPQYGSFAGSEFLFLFFPFMGCGLLCLLVSLKCCHAQTFFF